jgi:hypothetical protein
MPLNLEFSIICHTVEGTWHDEENKRIRKAIVLTRPRQTLVWVGFSISLPAHG